MGDLRWGGSFGVHADFMARDNCSVMWADIADVQVKSVHLNLMAILISSKCVLWIAN